MTLEEHPRDSHIRYYEHEEQKNEGDIVDAMTYTKLRVELSQACNSTEESANSGFQMVGEFFLCIRGTHPGQCTEARYSQT